MTDFRIRIRNTQNESRTSCNAESKEVLLKGGRGKGKRNHRDRGMSKKYKSPLKAPMSKARTISATKLIVLGSNFVCDINTHTDINN